MVGLSNPWGVPREASAKWGRLAQLARAPRLHRGGRRFESYIVHINLDNPKGLFLFYASQYLRYC